MLLEKAFCGLFLLSVSQLFISVTIVSQKGVGFLSFYVEFWYTVE